MLELIDEDYWPFKIIKKYFLEFRYFYILYQILNFIVDNKKFFININWKKVLKSVIFNSNNRKTIISKDNKSII